MSRARDTFGEVVTRIEAGAAALVWRGVEEEEEDYDEDDADVFLGWGALRWHICMSGKK